MLQSVHPWFSPEDIDKGARWLHELSGQLEKQSFAVLCLTAENLTAPWLIFEAGALSKAIDSSRVCPLLLMMEPANVQGPLAQFQSTRTTKDDLKRLVATINKSQAAPLPDGQFETLFEVLWPRLESSIAAISSIGVQAIAQHRPVPDLLGEVLERIRSMERQFLLSTDVLRGDNFERMLADFRRRQNSLVRNLSRAKQRQYEIAAIVKVALENLSSADTEVISALEVAQKYVSEAEAEAKATEEFMARLKQNQEVPTPPVPN